MITKLKRGPLLLVLLYAGLAITSWRRYADILVDFGRELYVPWQLLDGQVLYRDIAYFNGPLSPYFNTLIFGVFGVSIDSLIACNLIIIGLITILIYRLFAKACDDLVATMASVFFLLGFAFSHLLWHGIFGFVAPYSHEMSHGMLLAVCGLSVLGSPSDNISNLRRLIGSLFIGVTFLTKPEMALAAFAAFSAWTAVHWFAQSRKKAVPILRSILEDYQCVVLSITGLVAPFIIAVLVLSTQMTSELAFDGALGGWRYVFDDRIRNSLFYHQVMGTNRTVPHALIAVGHFVAALLAIQAVVGLDRWFHNQDKRSLIWSAVWLLIGAAIIHAVIYPWILAYDKPPTTPAKTAMQVAVFGLIAFGGFTLLIRKAIDDNRSRRTLVIGTGVAGCVAAAMALPPALIPQRSMPIFTFAIFVYLLVQLYRKSDDSETPWTDRQAKITILVPWMTLALVLLTKIVLAARLFHYGFALAMPAMLGSVTFIIYYGSELVKKRYGGGDIARFVWTGVLLIDMVVVGMQSFQMANSKTLPVGLGSDVIISHHNSEDDRGYHIQALLDDLKDRVEEDETLLVLPEGITINFFLRRRTSTRYVNFMPVETLMYGEETILESIQQAKPDYIALVHKNTGEYGIRFGTETYGQKIKHWIMENYEVEKQYGYEPFVGIEDFGIQLLVPKAGKQ